MNILTAENTARQSPNRKNFTAETAEVAKIEKGDREMKMIGRCGKRPGRKRLLKIVSDQQCVAKWSRLIRVWMFCLLIAAPGCAIVNRTTGVSQARELQKTGIPAEAKILELWDTGMTLNNDPVVWLVLEVHPKEGAPYRAKTKSPISRLDVPQFQPGAIVPVRYDPKDHQRVSLDGYRS
jgi:hypothetical protein